MVGYFLLLNNNHDMNAHLAIATLFLLFQGLLNSQNFESKEVTIDDSIDGTLLIPEKIKDNTLAILIADYGPVDRNGNQNFSNNGSLKKLAEALSVEGISSYRYDKRTFRLNKRRQSQQNVSFDDFVTDAKKVINFFADSNEYDHIYAIGHGQGSLVGMLSLDDRVEGFISIGGSAKPIDQVIVEQVTMMDEKLGKEAERIADEIKKGETVNNIPPALNSVFQKDVQAFMSSWMTYDPTNVLTTVTVPILILSGTKDLQVPIEEANDLTKTNDQAQLQLIEDMNHVMFIIKGGDLENSKSYNESFRPISQELINKIVDFVKN